jgi:hypothetical protein
MVFEGWYMNHRDVDLVKILVQKCSIPGKSIRFDYESERVNLFMHINLS